MSQTPVNDWTLEMRTVSFTLMTTKKTTAQDSIAESKKLGKQMRKSAKSASSALERASRAQTRSAVTGAYVTVSGRTRTISAD